MYTQAAFEGPTARVSSLQEVVQDLVLGLPASAAHGLHEHANIEYSLAYRIVEEISSTYLMRGVSFADAYAAENGVDQLATQMTRELMQKLKNCQAASVSAGSAGFSNASSPYSRRSGRTYAQEPRFPRVQARHSARHAEQGVRRRSEQKTDIGLPSVDFRAMARSIDDAALANPVYAAIVANPALESAITILFVVALTMCCGNLLLSSAH